MTILDWISSIGVIITILATVITGAWWLQGKFVAITEKFNENFLEINKEINKKFFEIDKKFLEIDKKFLHLEDRIDKINHFMDVISEVIKDILKVNETIIAALIRANLILPAEQITLYKSYSGTHTTIIDKSMKFGLEKSNPITKEEGERLWKYRDMCLEGKIFSVEEAEDFHRLVHELEDIREVHRDGGYGVLISLAALVLGVTLNIHDRAKQQQKEVMTEN